VKVADFLYLGLIAALLLLEHFVVWPGFLVRSQADEDRARLWVWSRWMLVLWTLTGAGIALWLFEARGWGGLRLVVPRGWRLWGAIGFVSALAIAYGRPIVRIARSKRRRRIQFGNPQVARIAPHTRSELGWWLALSLTAGFCEEFVFRGYLLWAFEPKLGLWGAAGVALVIFVAAHAYQGVTGVVPVAIVGALLTLTVLAFQSLLPAMVLHAVIDVTQGLLAWFAFRAIQGDGDAVTRLRDPA
jgi:membrane protease YdiL (CAAX protease family)